MSTRTLSTLERSVDEMTLSFEKPKFPVDGFEFELDTPESDSEPLLEPLQGMPSVNAFVYVDDQGRRYGEQRWKVDTQSSVNIKKD